jgi:hypothetical protein
MDIGKYINHRNNYQQAQEPYVEHFDYFFI